MNSTADLSNKISHLWARNESLYALSHIALASSRPAKYALKARVTYKICSRLTDLSPHWLELSLVLSYQAQKWVVWRCWDRDKDSRYSSHFMFLYIKIYLLVASAVRIILSMVNAYGSNDSNTSKKSYNTLSGRFQTTLQIRRRVELLQQHTLYSARLHLVADVAVFGKIVKLLTTCSPTIRTT